VWQACALLGSFVLGSARCSLSAARCTPGEGGGVMLTLSACLLCCCATPVQV
jgi:hypothetical protein